MTGLVISPSLAAALATWEAQCLKRGTRQDGVRWQEDDAVTGEGRWVPNMRPKPEDRELPTEHATKALERECAASAAALGITTTEFRRLLVAHRTA